MLKSHQECRNVPWKGSISDSQEERLICLPVKSFSQWTCEFFSRLFAQLTWAVIKTLVIFWYLEDYTTRQICRGFISCGHEIKIPMNQSIFHGFMSLAGKGFVAWVSQTLLAGDGCYQQCLLHCACHFADSFGRLGMSTAPCLCHQHHDSGLKSCTELIVINGVMGPPVNGLKSMGNWGYFTPTSGVTTRD